MLTETEIDVYRELDEEDDIDINEFLEDFGEAVVNKLYEIGCDTARDVLDLGDAELVKRTNGEIDLKTAKEIIKTIQAEFEEDETN
jgi:N utilization substance protein A